MNDRTAAEQVEVMRNLLAFLLVGAFIATLPLFVFKSIAAENKEIIVYMVGQLSGMATTALGFYFVSKVGQDALDAKRTENTAKLADLATNALEAGKPPEAKVEEAARSTAQAAADRADDFAGDGTGTEKPFK